MVGYPGHITKLTDNDQLGEQSHELPTPTRTINNRMIIDWQAMSMGRGVTDVAYFLAKVPIEDRRAHEMELFKLYHDTLCENGVVDYSYHQCWDDYRMAIFDGFWKSVFVIANRRQTESQLNLQRHVLGPRIFAAVLDLNSRETLSRLDATQV